MFIHLWETERDRVSGQGQRKRETQNLKQAPGSELSTQSPTRCSNPWIMRSWPELKLDTNWLSHPGAPTVFLLIPWHRGKCQLNKTPVCDPRMVKESLLVVHSSAIDNSQSMERAQCPSTDEWIKRMWSIYTMEYYSAIKKNEILPFATTWMELEGITLSEISQSEKDKNHMTSLIWGL